MSSANEIDAGIEAMMMAGLEAGDDPRITTYALGELEPAERAAFEAELLARPELKQEVDRVRKLARLIGSELQQDAAPVAGLPADVKAQVLAPIAKAGGVIRWRTYLTHMAAAGLLGVVGLGLTGTRRAEHVSPFNRVSVTIEGSDGNGGLFGEDWDTIVTAAEGDLNDWTEAPPESTEAAPVTATAFGVDTKRADGHVDWRASGRDKEAAGLSLGDTRLALGATALYSAAAPTSERPPATEVQARFAVSADAVARQRTPEELARERAEGEAESKAAREALSYALSARKLDRATKDRLQELVDRAGEAQKAGNAGTAAHYLDLALAEAGGDPRKDPAFTPAQDNPFMKAADESTGTFSIDVDTAGFATVRNSLERGQLPPAGSVRIEELLNYFPYLYAPPTDGRPFASSVEVTACPWQPKNRLVRIGIKGKELARDARPVSNLVFLVDVSGSMQEPQKLPLLKQSLTAMVGALSEKDRVAIVVYAGASGLVLPSTTGDRKTEIVAALDQLQAGGGTNGGAGMELAYKVAIEHYIQGGTNRVVLCTDGDWNVGVSGPDGVERLVVEKAKSGVFLTCLGFFGSNYQDQTMERMADKGSGNYHAIDSLREARKVLVEEMSGTLVTIAKDVKVQVEFNREKVEAYRLIGYENRVMANRDFSDDTKDAGEIGAGHCVTALYEVEPKAPAQPPGASGDLLTLRLRWKKPDGQTSELLETKVPDSDRSLGQASLDTRFAASVAAWGMLLRSSPYKGTASYGLVLELGSDALGMDPGGHRAAWLELVKKSQALAGK